MDEMQGRLVSAGPGEPGDQDVLDRTVSEVSEILGLSPDVARRVVVAFVDFVVEPLERKLRDLRPADVGRKNPFVYAALGITSVEGLTQRAAADITSSSIEGLVGNWLEEVAVVVSGGVKPGGGADLQVDRGGDAKLVDLYSIQSTTNTKNSKGRTGDEAALKTSANVLRAQRRTVDLYVAYLFGRQNTTELRGVTHLSSREFWDRVTGQEGFQKRLYQAMPLLAPLLAGRLNSDWAALTEAVGKQFGDSEGNLDPTKVRL